MRVRLPSPVPDDPVRAAIAGSVLADLPESAWLALADHAVLCPVPAGTILHEEGDSRPHLELVVGGLLRVFVRAEDGRTLTVRYTRPGALLGAASLYATSFELPATIQAVVDSSVVALSPPAVRQAVERDPRVARALLTELSDRVESFIAEIPWGAFATVRQRVARRLLDLAAENAHGAELVATVSQAQLAAECGTVREVVVRELRELRSVGLVATRRDSIVVLDPAELLARCGEPVAGAAGTQVPDR